MANYAVITRLDQTLPSPMRTEPSERPLLRVGAVQCAWSADAAELEQTLRNGVAIAANEGARVVLLQELTLSPYFCTDPSVRNALDRFGEEIDTGPTVTLARDLSKQHGITVGASLYERTVDGRGFNTAICVDADGALLARSRKTHIPEFRFYHEDKYFEPADEAIPVVAVEGAHFAFPTCWDQWFPEFARSLSMEGAEVIVYPTAIGSEPHLPDADTQPMWQQMIMANGLANATLMIAVNRIGDEPPLSFYGSSFISDPYGRKIIEAPRDAPTVLVADLDLDQRRDWLSFGLLYTRKPWRYATLQGSTDLGRPTSAQL